MKSIVSNTGQSYNFLDNAFNPVLGFEISSSLVTLVVHCFSLVYMLRMRYGVRVMDTDICELTLDRDLELIQDGVKR